MGVCAGAWLGGDEGSVMGVCARAWLGGDKGLVIGVGAWANHLCSLFLLSSSLSLFVSKSWNSFEGKIETKIHFRLGRVILQSTRKLIFV